MIGFGEWTDRHEEAYRRIKGGDLSNISDLDILMQPIKPFVFSRKQTEFGNEETLGVPFQVKNSEYLILLADAIISGNKNAKTPNYLKAIYEFMEESYDKMGPKKGIDTIEFASCVKVGCSGVINLHPLEKGEKVNTKEYSKDEIKNIKQILEDACYIKDENGKIVDYDTEFVHVIDYDDYGVQ